VLKLHAPGCSRCDCGAGGSLPCFPCDPPAADLYLTILDGREPYRLDIPAESPVEIVLPYDLVTRSWGPSACTRLAGPHIVSANPTTGAPTYTSENTYAVFFLFCASDFTPDGDVYRGRLLLGWTLWIDPPEGPLADPCDHPENAIGSYVLNPDYLSLADCAPSCDPLRVFWQASPPLDHFPWLLADSSGTASSDIPGIDVTLCVTVLKCPGGPAVSGGDVTFHWPGTLGVTYTGTTDGSGVYCHAVARAGRWDITVEVDGCEVTGSAVVAQCTGTVNVELYHCCGHACVGVGGLFADDADDADPTALEGSAVQTLDGVTLGTSDADGRACITLTSAEMLALSGAMGDCSTRLLPVRVLGPGATEDDDGPWLRRCVTVPIVCGRTLEDAQADPTTVVMSGLKRIDDTDAYVRPAAGLEGLCDDPGCGVEGWAGRVIPVAEDVQTDHDTYTWDDGLDSGVYNLLGTGAGAVTRLFLDTERFDGTTPTTWSPWDAVAGVPAQRVEYTAPHSFAWSSRTGGFSSSGGHLWLCQGKGLIVSHEVTGFDPTAETGLDRVFVAPTLPEGGGMGTTEVVFLRFDFDFDPCDLTTETESATVANALGSGNNLDWSVVQVPGVDPP
jgi:hypothetical protein